MVKFSSILAPLAASALIGSAVAHPGEHHDHAEIKREIAVRDELARHAKRSVDVCSTSITSRALHERAITRRAETAMRLRAERGLQGARMKHRRDLAELEAYELVSHNATAKGYTIDTDASVIFAANATYALSPNNTIGPYYVEGEYIRSNVTESETGIPMHLEFQFIDIETCDPVSDLLIDIWSCNATGVYSGIDTSSGEGGLNTTFLRGVQTTDDDGVAEFDTIFPGHYTGRATHEHVVSHINGTVLANGTYTGGTVNHIGQLFFDESLRAAVELTYPYNTNTQDVVSNDDDMWAPYGATADYDPFPEYVMLGETLDDGLLVFITIGINTTANFDEDADVAAYYEADGGHTNEDSSFASLGSGSGSGPSSNSSSGNSSAPSFSNSSSVVKARSAAQSTQVWGYLVLTCALTAVGSALLM